MLIKYLDCFFIFFQRHFDFPCVMRNIQHDRKSTERSRQLFQKKDMAEPEDEIIFLLSEIQFPEDTWKTAVGRIDSLRSRSALLHFLSFYSVSLCLTSCARTSRTLSKTSCCLNFAASRAILPVLTGMSYLQAGSSMPTTDDLGQ